MPKASSVGQRPSSEKNRTSRISTGFLSARVVARDAALDDHGHAVESRVAPGRRVDADEPRLARFARVRLLASSRVMHDRSVSPHSSVPPGSAHVPVSARRTSRYRPSASRPTTATPTTGRRSTWRRISFIDDERAGRDLHGGLRRPAALAIQAGSRMKLVTFRNETGHDRAGVLVPPRAGGRGDRPRARVSVVRALARAALRRSARVRPLRPRRARLRRARASARARSPTRSSSTARAPALPRAFEGAPLATPLDKVTLRAPIPRPPSMRDGYAFRQHVETARRNRGLDMIPEFDQFPVFYFTNHQAS